MVLQGKDPGNPTCHYEDRDWALPLDDDLRDLWDAVPVPDAPDVHRLLLDAGMKGVAPGAAAVVKRPAARPARRTQKPRAPAKRTFKLTNTHLPPELDMSVDH